MLVQLIYISKPTESARAGVLTEMPRYFAKNKEDGLNTILLATDNFFLQSIEGDRDKVNELYKVLVNDPRHSNVTVVRYQEIRKCEFLRCHIIHMANLDSEYINIEYLKEVNRVEDLDYTNMTSALAIALLRRSFAVIKSLTYPSRRKTDLPIEIDVIPEKYQLRANA